jgi:hypothetical protein
MYAGNAVEVLLVQSAGEGNRDLNLRHVVALKCAPAHKDSIGLGHEAQWLIAFTVLRSQ